MSGAHAGTPAGGVACPLCKRRWDAATVQFCECLTAARTPLCPHCRSCLCKLPREQQQAFWSAAPPELSRRAKALRQETPADQQAPTRMLFRPLALVADDDGVTRTMAKRMLEKLGMSVVTADRGDRALELAREMRPDLVLTDALMPRLDGRELCLRLKRDPATAGAKVIVMTGLYTKSQDRTEALRTFKVDAFLAKPVSPEELATVLAELLPRKR